MSVLSVYVFVFSYVLIIVFIFILVFQIHAVVLEGLRGVMANAVTVRNQFRPVSTNNETWASSNLALNTRPRIKRGGGM